VTGSATPQGRLDYAPVRPLLVRAEAQRVDRAHPAIGYGVHAHDFFEILLFDVAGGIHTVAGRTFPIEVGQVWLLPPGVSHDLAGLGAAEGWVLVAGAEALGLPAGVSDLAPFPLHPLVVGFQQLDDTGRPLPLLLDPDGLGRWTGWLSQLARECTEARPGYQYVVAALMQLVLVDAGRRCSPAPTPAADELVRTALTIVDERFHERLTLSDVARTLAVTPGHLTEVVRRRSGRPLGEWILQRRLARARLLLAETTQPIRSVSSACGFADVGHFSRQFRRHHGLSPSAWRSAVVVAPAQPSPVRGDAATDPTTTAVDPLYPGGAGIPTLTDHEHSSDDPPDQQRGRPVQ
jgi:AraC family transcriptional activator of pobA